MALRVPLPQTTLKPFPLSKLTFVKRLNTTMPLYYLSSCIPQTVVEILAIHAPHAILAVACMHVLCMDLRCMNQIVCGMTCKCAQGLKFYPEAEDGLIYI